MGANFDGDTRKGATSFAAYTPCGLDATGHEVVYRIDLAQRQTIGAYVVDHDGVDVEVAILSAAAASSCVAAGGSTATARSGRARSTSSSTVGHWSTRASLCWSCNRNDLDHCDWMNWSAANEHGTNDASNAIANAAIAGLRWDVDFTTAIPHE